MTELQDVLGEMETAGDAARVERYVLDASSRAAQHRRWLYPAVSAAAVVLAIAVGAVVLATRGAKPAIQSAGGGNPATTVHPGLDQLTKTCLDQAEVIRAWGGGASAAAGYGGLAYTKADGTQCTYEAENILSTHPATGTARRAHGMTVYILPTSAGIRTGYVPFTAAEVAAYLEAAHKTPDPGLRLYRIVSIPADNPERVLITILEQTRTQYPSR